MENEDFSPKVEFAPNFGHLLPVHPAPISLHSAFSAEECAALRCLATPLEPATVWDGMADAVMPATRRAHRRYLPRNGGPEWLFTRLDSLFAQGSVHFEALVDPVFEPVQLIRYRTGDHFQAWHTDAGADRFDERRLSLSVELSAPDEHDGGVLEFGPRAGVGRDLPLGAARLFPSRMIHRVTPVTRGERWVLVAWTGLAPQPSA